MLEGHHAGGHFAIQRSCPSLLGTRLAASPFLSDEERHALESIALAPKSFAAGKHLLREGELAGHFQILIEGWACRYKTTRDGRRQIVTLLIPGDAVNVDSLSFMRPDYTARTLTAAKVLSLPRDRVLSLTKQHCGIANTLAWLAMCENAILGRWTLCLGRLSAEQRLAHLLCEVSVRVGHSENEEESPFELPLTQEQIGDVLGLTAVHINRTIRRLRTQGLIEAKARAVTIVDMDALRRIADFDPAYLHHRRAKSQARQGRSANVQAVLPANLAP